MAQTLTDISFSPSSNPLSGSELSPSNKPGAETSDRPSRSGDNSRWQMRLVITVPALLILFILTYGLISYLSFTSHWAELEEAGAFDLAADLLRIHMTAMVVLAVIAAFMGVALSWSILRPIRAIARVAEDVALGKFDRYAPDIPASRELGDLSRTFNAMIDQLNHSIAGRNRRLIEGIPMGVLTVDMDGRINTVNPMAAESLGLDISELMGLSFDQIEPKVSAQAQPLAAFMSQTLRQDVARATHEVTLETGQADTSKRSLIITATALKGTDHKPFGVMFHFRDAEQVRDLSVQIGRTDHLAMLGTFSLGLAHELRNPLGAIKGLSQLLLLERGLPETTGGYLERMTREVDRVDRVVRELLDLSIQPVGRPVPTDISLMLTEAREMARLGIAPEQLDAVAIDCHIAPMPRLLLQGDRMAQAIAKIINNAYHACEAAGRIRVKTQWQSQPGGTYACQIHIGNNGPAIDPQIQAKIFEPFFTTREKATGLGLTIANQIVVQNEGTIELRNGEAGVEFIIRFDPARTADGIGWPDASGKAAPACR